MRPHASAKIPAAVLVLPLALASTLVTLAAPAAHAGDLRIHHLDVEQGDATLIVSPEGRAMLVDGGPTGTGTRRIVPRLRELGVTSLDFTVASHYHEDHVGGIDEVVAAGFAPGVAWDRGDANTASTVSYRDYVAAVAPVRHTITPGQTIALGAEVILTCVAVNGVTAAGADVGVGPGEENEASVALVLRYRGFDYFVGGDLTGGGAGTKDVETLVAPLVRDLDVLRVCHHGSLTATNENLLARTLPEVAVISCGTASSYGHPDPEVLARLTALPSCAAIWATNPGSSATSPKLIVVGSTLAANDGEITVTTDGVSGYRVNGVSYPLVVDRAAPTITSGPSVVARHGRSATITFTTSEPTEGFIECGTGTAFGGSVVNPVLSTTHTLTIGGLTPETTYRVRAGAVDATGNGPALSAEISFSTIAAGAGVVVNEVAPAGSGADEWVELLNAGTQPVDMTGFALTDNDSHDFVFPPFTLAPGAYVVVTSASTGADGPDARGVMTFQGALPGRFGTTSVWNNGGDDVELRDAQGRTIDWVAFGTGTGIDAPPSGHWLSTAAYPEAPTAISLSIARFPNGADDNALADWKARAQTTRGASNGGEPPPPPVPPRAIVASTSVPGVEGAVVRFDGSASTVPEGEAIVRYLWTFGDGALAEGDVVEHVYADSGCYEATLTITDSRGMTSQCVVAAEIENVAPSAQAGGPYAGLAGQAVSFLGAGTDPSPGDADTLTFAWTFGDGTGATGQAATHTYGAAGTFAVVLTVTDKDGASATHATTVTIGLPALSLRRPAVSAVRDASTGTVSGAGSAALGELNATGELATKLYVNAGEGAYTEARFGSAGPAWRVESASVTIAYRMTSSTWAGTLRAELWAGGTYLGHAPLAKSTTTSTVTLDASSVLRAEHLADVSVRLVNTDPRGLKVIWSYAALEVAAR